MKKLSTTTAPIVERKSEPDPIWGNVQSNLNSESTVATSTLIDLEESPAKPKIQAFENLQSQIQFSCKTLYAYEAQESGELSFPAEAIIHVTSLEEDPWWTGFVDGTQAIGSFPSNFVKRF